MQIKVRARCKNPTCKMYTTCPECRGTGWGEEEWESLDVILSGLNERIDALTGPVRCIETLVRRVNQLERENVRLAKRIERLETSFKNVAIDVNNRIERLELADDHERHQAALEEEHEADLVQEWYEEQLDEAATHCARCGGELSAISWSCGVLTDLCPECESELAEEQATMLLPYPDEEPF